jgi:hypothetical protein
LIIWAFYGVEVFNQLGSNAMTKNRSNVLEKSQNANSKVSNGQDGNSKPSQNLKWYETDSPALTIVLLILLTPVGLWSMWKYIKWPLKKKAVITGVSLLGYLIYMGLNRTPSATQTQTTSTQTNAPVITSDRTFLGRSKTGYELWADKTCVYVKGITEADLARLNSNVWDYKEAVKHETGFKCVMFE